MKSSKKNKVYFLIVLIVVLTLGYRFVYVPVKIKYCLLKLYEASTIYPFDEEPRFGYPGVCEYLYKIGKPATPALVHLLRLQHPYLREFAVRGLGYSRDKSVAEILLLALRDPQYQAIRTTAHGALATLTDYDYSRDPILYVDDRLILINYRTKGKEWERVVKMWEEWWERNKESYPPQRYPLIYGISQPPKPNPRPIGFSLPRGN